jgi:hypothetical protein
MSELLHSAVVMSEVPMDQRCGTRIPCDLRVVVMVRHAVFGPGVLLNVSIGGALLQTPMILTPLTQIELEVEGPGMGRSSIMACITRREVHQYGVAFLGNNNTIVDKMLRLAQSQAAAPHVTPSGEPPRQHHRRPEPSSLPAPEPLTTGDILRDSFDGLWTPFTAYPVAK